MHASPCLRFSLWFLIYVLLLSLKIAARNGAGKMKLTPAARNGAGKMKLLVHHNKYPYRRTVPQQHSLAFMAGVNYCVDSNVKKKARSWMHGPSSTRPMFLAFPRFSSLRREPLHYRAGAARRLLCKIEVSLRCTRHFFSTADPVGIEQDTSCKCDACGGGNRVKSITRISYMTDVEGDGSYFDRFVEGSPVLGFRFVSDKDSLPDDVNDWHGFYSKEVIFLENNDHDKDHENVNNVLVFGGDVWDKGGSDFYVLRQLLSLRDRYGPDRVHFIMGNRDINKIRISQELGLFSSSRTDILLPRSAGVYWLRGTGRPGDPEGVPVPSDSPAVRLKWMLGQTMGSPDAFELRRKEVRAERKRRENRHGEDDPTDWDDSVSDEVVVRSYQETCNPSDPEGIMSKYLSWAVLVQKIGSVMFMHGALPLPPSNGSVIDEMTIGADDIREENMERLASFSGWDSFEFAIPWAARNADGERSGEAVAKIDTPEKWIEALNDFARDQVGKWKSLSREEVLNGGVWSSSGGYQNTTTGGIGGGSLLQYGMSLTPERRKNPTVVYASWLSDAMPKFATEPHSDHPTAALINEFFDAAELSMIVTGHKPHGDLPLPIRMPSSSRCPAGDRSRWIVTCDTSYSGDTKWVDGKRINLGRGTRSLCGRGDIAVSELVIELCNECDRILSAYSHGVMSDGTSYKSTNLMDEEESVFVGRAVDTNLFSVDGNNHTGWPLGSTKDGGNKNNLLWWVKTKLDDGSYVVSTASGFNVWNSIAREKR